MKAETSVSDSICLSSGGSALLSGRFSHEKEGVNRANPGPITFCVEFVWQECLVAVPQQLLWA